MTTPRQAHPDAFATSGRPRVALVIPTLNEEEPIGEVIRAIPRDAVDEVIVVDSDSEDRTVERAREAGAHHRRTAARLWPGLRRRRPGGA
jgi:glycosyltransferase involved in cell wall biosynthesis